MTYKSETAPSPRRSRVRYSDLLAACAVLFVLQTGLVPFDFGDPSASPAMKRVFGASRTPFTFPDIVSNLFLYIPVGILFQWSFRRRVRRGITAVLLSVAAAAALSGGIELIQAYSPTRVSSVIDLTCNVLGAGIGIIVGSLCGWILPAFLDTLRNELHRRPRAMLLAAYVFVLIGVSATPFSFSLDVNLFKKSLKKVSLVPFRSVQDANSEARQAISAENYRQYSLARWRSLKCWSRWSLEFISFAVLAWLARPIIRDDYGFSRAATVVLLWWLCGGLALVFSMIQLILVTRGLDTTDLLFRLVGIGAGLMVRPSYTSSSEMLSRRAVADKWRRLCTLGCVASLACIVYSGLIPLTINMTESGPERTLASSSFLPFFAYFVTRFDVMMADVMEKFISYGIFATLLASCWTRAARMSLISRVLAIASLGVAISIPLEVVQIFIPVRIASLTDLILAGAGAAFGVLVHEKATAWYRDIEVSTLASGGVGTNRMQRSKALPPADALVATLVDPRADAPAEKVGRPLPQAKTD